jgi:hypothetical protein
MAGLYLSPYMVVTLMEVHRQTREKTTLGSGCGRRKIVIRGIK